MRVLRVKEFLLILTRRRAHAAVRLPNCAAARIWRNEWLLARVAIVNLRPAGENERLCLLLQAPSV